MKKIINIVLCVLKVVLLLVSIGLIFYGLLVTYNRVNKSIIHAIPVILPFVLLLILFVIDFIYKIKLVNKNLFYNATAVISLLAINFIGLRAKFETNATLYHKYKIGYNPSYLSDNIGTIQTLAYLLVIVNALLIAHSIFFKKEEANEVKKDEQTPTLEVVSSESDKPVADNVPVAEKETEELLTETLEDEGSTSSISTESETVDIVNNTN